MLVFNNNTEIIHGLNNYIQAHNYDKDKTPTTPPQSQRKKYKNIGYNNAYTQYKKYKPTRNDNDSFLGTRTNPEKTINNKSLEKTINNKRKHTKKQEKEILEFQINILEKDFLLFSNSFYHSQTNPETLIKQPLLLDVNIAATRSMIESYNTLKDAMDTLDKKKHLTQLQYLLEKAKLDYNTADSHSLSIGIPGTDSTTRRKAQLLLDRVLDDGTTIKEKETYWNSILKIVRNAGIRESSINVINTQTKSKILTGNTTTLKAITT